MDAPRPQPVLGPITEAAIFLVLTVEEGAVDDVREALTDVSALKRSVGFRIPEGQLTCVVGIGSSCWDRMYGEPRPAGLHPLSAVVGRHSAVSTPGDLLFHVRAHRFDLCFELAGRLVDRFGEGVRMVDEVHGFRYFDERDLLGFVDGTENPEGGDAAEAVLIGREDPGFESGTYVVVQKYLHDLGAWNALSAEEQERVIGRTKVEDIELPDEVKPANSHVALNTVVDEEGREHQIVRFNMAFGTAGLGEAGTYFIGYARKPDLIELMLRNMFIGKPPGNHDRILDFSRAVTGSLFFVPSAAFLDDPAMPAAPRLTGANEHASADGSLGIGGLRDTAEDRASDVADRQ